MRSVAIGQADGRPVIVSGSNDHTVRVWDATTGTPIGDPFTGHTDWVRSVAIGQVDGRPVIVSGSNDHTVRVWNAVVASVYAQQLRLSLSVSANVYAVAVGHSSNFVIATELGIVSIRVEK